jgi:hypothetical protein
MSESKSIEFRRRIIKAGEEAVEELIRVAKEKIIKPKEEVDGESPALAADRLKNAAATKKAAIFDAFEILDRIEKERDNLDLIEKGIDESVNSKTGFAERRSKRSNSTS